MTIRLYASINLFLKLKEACTSELDRLQGVSKRYEQICALYEADRHEIQRRATALQDKMAECSMCKSLVTNLSSYLTDVELPDTSSSMPSQNGAGAKLLPQPSSTKMGQSVSSKCGFRCLSISTTLGDSIFNGTSGRIREKLEECRIRAC